MQHITLQVLLSMCLVGWNASGVMFTEQYGLAPEICDNGIDDDGDGLIDLQDPDCDCQPAPLDYIPNPSFEDFDTCPSGYSQMDHCADWIQPGRGTPDYFHQCGFMGIFNEVVQPLPDGDGCVAFSNSPSSNIGYKEYVGVCLNNPLASGKGYMLEFSIGFKDLTNSPPTSFSIFGNTSCADLAAYDSSSEDCPTTQPGWIELAKRTVSGNPQEWARFSLEIHPQQNINSIILGGDCEIMNIGDDNYYFLDELELFEIFSIPDENGNYTSEPYIRDASGHPCRGNLVLETFDDINYSYQWYRNGIAIAGADQANYAVPAGESGDYRVRVNRDGTCATSEIYEVRISSFTTRIEETICRGETFEYKDSTFSTPGMHTYSLTTSDGCDSLIEIELSLRSPDEVDLERTICEGEGFQIGPNTYSQSGFYRDTLQNTAGCDSIVSLDLEVIDHTTTTIQQAICRGDQYLFDGQWLTQPGQYSTTLTSNAGCDSVIELQLDVTEPSEYSLNRVICQGETFSFGGKNLNSTGIYRDTLVNSTGCDSVITLDLEVQEAFLVEQEASICEGEYYSFHGTMLESEGIYEKTFSSVYGCDSTIRLELRVHSNSVELGPDRSVELGESIQLDPVFDQDNIIRWMWSNEQQEDFCPDCTVLNTTPMESGWIRLTAVDEHGCTFSDEIEVIVTNKSNGLYIPNAFSPNGDGINDYFRPYASGKIRSIRRLSIFNRSGQLVFDRRPLGSDEKDGWNGYFDNRQAPAGVYIYLIEVEYINGTTRQFRGDLTLIR